MEGGKAGIHNSLEFLDSGVRGNDRNGAKRTFYEGIKSVLGIFFAVLGAILVYNVLSAITIEHGSASDHKVLSQAGLSSMVGTAAISALVYDVPACAIFLLPLDAVPLVTYSKGFYIPARAPFHGA